MTHDSPEPYVHRRVDWKMAIMLSVTIATMTAFVILLLVIPGCHVSPTQAPKATRVALAKVGAAYSALSIAYQAAVDVRIEVCKHKLAPDASEADRVSCMGPLASDGKLTLAMIRAKDLYDEGAEVLKGLADELEVLQRELGGAQ